MESPAWPQLENQGQAHGPDGDRQLVPEASSKVRFTTGIAGIHTHLAGATQAQAAPGSSSAGCFLGNT